MTPLQLSNYLQYAIKNRFPVLIKAAPGVGKSDITTQATALAGAEMVLDHPVISDPTDFKGLPFSAIENGKPEAHLLPFRNLRKLIDATKPTVYFLDDLGQAPASVQAACMQLILARQIGEHKVSDYVTFIAATNRKEDKAGVSGLLEPVKSRFVSIIELEVTAEDWVKWALNNNMPTELIAFIRFRPELLHKFEATKDIVNTPSPRTVANVGKQQAAGLPKELEFEVIKGAAGEAFALEYIGFLDLFRNMPSIDDIILNPTRAAIPTQPGILFGMSGALAHKMNDNNIAPIITYLERLPAEIAVCCIKDAVTKKPDLKHTREFIKWAVTSGNDIL